MSSQVNIDSDFGLILNCALRYGIGRRTYIVDFICKYIEKYAVDLDSKTICIMLADIKRQKKDTFIDKPLGDPCDEENWLKLEEFLNRILKQRIREEGEAALWDTSADS